MPPEDEASARAALVRAFRDRLADVDALARSAVAHLHANWPQTGDALASDELLAELLVSVPIYPLWLERRLTGLRRRFLLRGGGGEATAPLLGRLAIQCHLNEYAWAVDAEESALVETLAAKLATLGPAEAMTLACYVPLSRVPGSADLVRKGWTGPVQAVLQEQIVAVREERILGAQVSAIAPIRHGVSETVKAQYEASPYPRWRMVTPVRAQATIFGWPIPKAPSVLIAGCGTGIQAIRAAQRYSGGRVLAIDLSRASLSYALRKTQEEGLANITFAQADLLELGSTGWTFDLIECGGVLHHLSDPFEGARVLSGLLRPGGAIKLALYSAPARADLKPAKALARAYTPDTIRELRQAIIAAPEGDPLKAAMRFTDFYSTASCRDLLMHVQEHELAIGDLKRMLAENGLRLLAFAIEAQVKTAYAGMFPDDPRAVDLDHWAEFEQQNPRTFSGMYQFWAEKPG